MDSSACASRLEKGERGAAELSLQRHGRSIDEWSIKVLTALALMTCYTTATLHPCAAVVPAIPPLIDETLRRRRCDDDAMKPPRTPDGISTLSSRSSLPTPMTTICLCRGDDDDGIKGTGVIGHHRASSTTSGWVAKVTMATADCGGGL